MSSDLIRRALLALLGLVAPLVAYGAHNPLQDTEFFPLLEGLPSQAPLSSRYAPPKLEPGPNWRALKGKILSDFGNRMTPEFAVPEGLKERASFWFDIYARYGEHHHVIHHQRYPWIVFRVVDTAAQINAGTGPLWLRRDRAAKWVKHQASEIRATLASLARRRSHDKLTPGERDLVDRLADLPGTRKSVFRTAAESVRVQLGQRDFFERGLIRSSRYLPYMESEFANLGLPTELTRLPFVESSFNEEAFSKVGASGIWQIMPATGRAYLIVTRHIDERNSPLKATVAAGRLLRSYFRTLGSWPLALTSYNNGIGNTRQAMRGAGSRDLAVIIERYHRGDFRFASSNFFTCFLAALYAEKYHELLFKSVPRDPLLERETLRLGDSRSTVDSLAKSVGVQRQILLKYNLDLRSASKANARLPRGYELHLPPGLKDQLLRRVGTAAPAKKPAT